MNPETLGWILVLYLLASVITFLLYAFDKLQARRGKRRVSEKALHIWELCGGWPGAWLAQRHFHHKTRKRSFLYVSRLVIVLHWILWGTCTYFLFVRADS